MTTYKCGNCGGAVRQSTVKCSDNTAHQAWVCERCGCSWFGWQLQRDIAWQKREDEWKLRKAAKA